MKTFRCLCVCLFATLLSIGFSTSTFAEDVPAEGKTVTTAGGTAYNGTATEEPYGTLWFNLASGGTQSGALTGNMNLKVQFPKAFENSNRFVISSTNNSFTGSIEVNTGTLRVDDPSSLGANKNITFTDGSLMTTSDGFDNSYTFTITGDKLCGLRATGNQVDFGAKITGAGSLEIVNDNPVVLSNTANDYQGATYIGKNGWRSNGQTNIATLKLGASGVLPDTTVINMGGGTVTGAITLDLNGVAETVAGLNGTTSSYITNTKAAAAASLTLNTASGQSYDYKGSITGNSATALTTINVIGAGTQDFSSTTTFTNTNLSVGDTATLKLKNVQTLPNLNVGANATLSAADNSTLMTLTLTGAAASSIAGTLSASATNINYNGTGTLTLSGTNAYNGTTTVSGGRVIATNVSALGNGAVTNNSELEFNLASPGEYSKVISGTGALIKSGNGKLILSGTNDYSGITTISEGTLAISGSGVINAASVINIAENGTLELASTAYKQATPFANTITGAGTLLQVANSAGMESDISDFTGTFEIQEDIYFTGNINGSKSEWTVSDGATLKTVSGNTIQIKSITTDSGTYLARNWASADDPISIYKIGSGVISGTIGYTAGTNETQKQLMSGVALEKVSDGTASGGTLTLSGTNNYSGGTTITAGTLSVSNPASLGSGTIALEENGTLEVTGTGEWSKTFTGTGKIDVNPSTFTHFLFNGSTMSGFSGTVDIEKTRFRAAIDTRTTNYITYNVGNPDTPTNDVQLWINAITVNGTFNLASLGYTTNPYAGGGEGAIRLENGSTVGGTINVLNDSCIGTYDANQNVSNTVSASINLNDKNLYIGNYDYTSNLDQFRSVTLSGAISGTGNLLLQPGTDKTVTISSANNPFTGTTTVGNATRGPGTLVLTGENAIANSTSVIVNTGITFGSTTQTFQNLSGAGTISGSGALTLFNDTATTYSGAITGTGASVTKTGAGVLTLSGENTYSGATTISEGTLNLGIANAIATSNSVINNVAITATSAQTFNNLSSTVDTASINLGTNALTLNNTTDTVYTGNLTAGTINVTGSDATTLKLNGTINGDVTVSSGNLDVKGMLRGALVVNAGSIFSPGNSIGHTEQTGGFTLSANAKILYELSADDYDWLRVSETATFEKDSIIALSYIGALPSSAKSYELLTSTTLTLTEADFNWNKILTDAGLNTANWSWNIANNNIVLNYAPTETPVPEPSTWALLILGALGLMYFRRKK